MRRLDLINSAHKVVAAIRESKITEIIAPVIRSSDDKIDPLETLNSYQKFLAHYNTFSATEKKILEIFGLGNIMSNQIWAAILISQEKKQYIEITRELRRGLYHIEGFLINFIELLKQNHLNYAVSDNTVEITSPIKDERELLTLILPESENEVSKPERLIEAIESILLFYKTIAELDEVNPNDLTVVAIDSGSDKSFDFLGAAKVIISIKELIIELWDRIVFYKERKLSQQIDVIAKALPVYEKVNEMQQNGKIGPEQGEIFRRNLENGVSNFIRVGAILPEFEEHSTFNPRQIMSPEKKLLSYPEGEKSRESTKKPNVKDQPNDENHNNPTLSSINPSQQFTPEQIEILEGLFGKKIDNPPGKQAKTSTKKPSTSRRKKQNGE